MDGQYGLEDTPAEYVETMRVLFAEVRRVLTDDGTLWLNIGDSYNAYNGNRGITKTGFSRNTPMPSLPSGSELTAPELGPKNLIGIPWRVAFALQDDGWILRNDIIWAKPNGMPESVTHRLTTKHEHVFMLSKQPRYWFDLNPIREPNPSPHIVKEPTETINGDPTIPATYGTGTRHARGKGHGFDGARPQRGRYNDPTHSQTGEGGRNPGDVWSIATQPFNQAHFAVMPVAPASRAIQSGCKPGGIVLDPFSGSGTTGLAAAKHGRKYVGIDLNVEYLNLSLRTRLAQSVLDFGEPA